MVAIAVVATVVARLSGEDDRSSPRLPTSQASASTGPSLHSTTQPRPLETFRGVLVDLDDQSMVVVSARTPMSDPKERKFAIDQHMNVQVGHVVEEKLVRKGMVTRRIQGKPAQKQDLRIGSEIIVGSSHGIARRVLILPYLGPLTRPAGTQPTTDR